MEYLKFKKVGLRVSRICLGTWALGQDPWWGPQADRDSYEVLSYAVLQGVNFLDTSPVYGQGHAEKIIGNFLKIKKNRDKIIVATKTGLTRKDGKVVCDLSAAHILKELDGSRLRLDTDYIDLYQVHRPDPATPVARVAATLHKLFQTGVIKAIGVSNFSRSQLQEFLKEAPLHCLQMPYNFFERTLEKELMPSCRKNHIDIITYSALASGILTGKFFFPPVSRPAGTLRENHPELKEPRYSVNKEALKKIKTIAKKYDLSLAQLALSWLLEKNVTSIVTGMRDLSQAREDLAALGSKIAKKDSDRIDSVLREREQTLKKLS